MKSKLIVLLLSLIVLSCKKGQTYPYEVSDFNDSLRPQLKKLIREERLPLQDTSARHFLEKHASRNDLVRLMDFENPLVRVVAFRTLVKRNDPDYFDSLLGHLNDTVKVEWWPYDDVQDHSAVSDLMARKVIMERLLSREEIDILSDSILSHHSYLESADWIIQDIKPLEKHYRLIRERVETNAPRCGIQGGASFALSKFRKKQDVKLLYTVFRSLDPVCAGWTFKSIEIFPDPVFFPILLDYFDESIKNKLLPDTHLAEDVIYFARAVAAYKNEEALYILNYIEEHNTFIGEPYWPPHNKIAVYKAILLHDSPIYKTLVDKIKPQIEEDKRIRIENHPKEYDERGYW